MRSYSGLVLIGFLLALQSCSSVGHQPGWFSSSGLDGWQPQRFGLLTQYRVIDNDGQKVLQANSRQSASALYRKLDIDLDKTPYLNWQWKVQHTLGELDEQVRAGDDFAARVYVMVSPQSMHVYPRALCYVWASNTPVGGSWRSPYANDVIIIPLQSGNQYAGQWRTEKRNVKQDLIQYFGEEFQIIEAIAVMTDTDNSKSEALSYFGDLVFTAK